MLFTIAIPTYNNYRTIQKAIESSINQNYDEEYEVLVVNNNSTDSTSEILSNYENNIRIINNGETVSMYENHNICLKNANGDYVIFCHSDDILLPDALFKVYNNLKAKGFPKSIVIWGRSMFRDFYGNWSQAGFRINEIASGITSLNAFFHGGLTPSGTCYSKKSFIKEDGFINIEHWLSVSDMVTMWKLVIRGFEFMMIDRLLFIRLEASTANDKNVSKGDFKEAFIKAVDALKKNINADEFNRLINWFEKTNNYYRLLSEIFEDKGLLNKKLNKKKAIRFFLKHPLSFLRFSTWQQILKFLF